MSDPQTISFFVPGVCVPQGSTKGFYIEEIHKVVITHGNTKTEGWRDRMAHEAKLAAQEYQILYGKPFYAPPGFPITITATHYFALPKTKMSNKWLPPPMVTRPDVDKLLRADLDALTKILFNDDSQVNCVITTKQYVTAEAPMAGIQVTITIGVDKVLNPNYGASRKKKA